MQRIFFLLILSLIFSSCIVSKKKFDDMLAQKIKAEGELSDKTRELDRASESLKKLKQDSINLNENLLNGTKKLAGLNAEYEKLNANYKISLNNSGKLSQDLARQRDQLLAKKDKAVQDLKTKISNALLNFKENDLTVKVKNGKVYISLAEQLLFGSGSIVVDKKGENALQQLAKALKDQKDIHVMIEGHTDNVQISKKSQYMEDNWDLSVMRATSITKILTKAGMSPNQITAAGKGEFSPVAPNDNAANKQKNRRTEIIVTPNLDELFKILDTN